MSFVGTKTLNELEGFKSATDYEELVLMARKVE